VGHLIIRKTSRRDQVPVGAKRHQHAKNPEPDSRSDVLLNGDCKTT
jgi:hypothetical protein